MANKTAFANNQQEMCQTARPARICASRAERDSSAVAGRKPCFFRMLSHSATVISGPTNLPVRSMREEVGEVVFGVLLNVADGIIKSLIVCHGRTREFATQALSDPENIAVGKTMRGVVAGDAMDRPRDFGKKHNAEGCGFSCNDFTPCEYAPTGEPLNEFLFRHRREGVAQFCGWDISRTASTREILVPSKSFRRRMLRHGCGGSWLEPKVRSGPDRS